MSARVCICAVCGAGSACRTAKLNEDQVIEIRNATSTAKFLAAHYGVSESLIEKVRRGVLWKHVAVAS